MATVALERPIGRLTRLPERRLQRVAPLVVDDGCDVRLRGGVHDAVRVALLEWLPLTPSELRVVEREGGCVPPTFALAALVRPPTIWTIEEALAAARTQLDDEVLRRLRGSAARLAWQLPVTAFPVARAAAARGCDAVAADDDLCASVAFALLARYAASALVARRRREAAPTMA